jgi:hypothetical protein
MCFEDNFGTLCQVQPRIPVSKGASKHNTPYMFRAATQQFLKPFDELPHGWKTICFLESPEGVPNLIANLPMAESWYETAADTEVLLSNDDT